MSEYKVDKIISNQPGPNPRELIWKERANQGNFPKKMHNLLEGPEKAEQILSILKQLERDTVLCGRLRDYDVTKAEQRKITAQRIDRMARFLEKEPREKFNRRLQLLNIYDPSAGIRIGVNLGLFGNCIKGNGTEEQYKYWCLDKQAGVLNHMYGCFGMTELAHGSNVAGVETTATFDPETDEFIIDTPHIGATKWWIGGAAHSATHSVIYARLIVKGKDYGVKTFVVPLRDRDHEIYAGVAIGDIGSKMGREGVDNGWIQFSDYRIPRSFMLQRYCKVSRDGNVTLPPLEQLSYISLLEGRVGMATDSYRTSSRFVTIATRYGVGRRQFVANLQLDGGEEMQILDYPLHQRRLFPILGLTYAMAFGTDALEIQHAKVLKDLEFAVSQKDEQGTLNAIAQTKSLFIDSAAMKSTLTWLAADNITECRQACGGHGYSSYSGFGKAYDDWVVQCTWEGDNNVLAMSAGKSIITNVQQVLEKGRTVGGSLSFLSKAKEYVGTETVLGSGDYKSPEKVLKALEVTIVRVAHGAIQSLKSGSTWDDISPTRVILSKLRCHHYLLTNFIEKIKVAEKDLVEDLKNLIAIYITVFILEGFTAQFLSYNIVKNDVLIESTNFYVLDLCAKIRPRAITLTDSFQLPDMVINSALGRYDGDIYHNYFDEIKTLNPPFKDKAPYQEALSNMLNRASLDDRDRQEKSYESLGYLDVPFVKPQDDDDDDDED